MGFIDSIKDALGGDHRDHDHDEPADEATPRHVDREAREEPEYGPPVTGGKHRA